MLASGALAPADQFVTAEFLGKDIYVRTSGQRGQTDKLFGDEDIYSATKVVPLAGQGGQNLKIWPCYDLPAGPRSTHANFQPPSP